ncbi:MAG: ATP:cob(I)alamin adenosyltransferase [Erysipelotrichaceae bacterium]|nr:ATP:cob(I)alamin adenosyltransferase [Erysipelotrichaceae bacterium]MDD3924583.1 ATP:cob(I)alamin adenosyltransferase [Erysipelotrichaceae bacterium]MDD4643242.1 ATP:cob(I)alamin adenosyltransferase [Erysipelotrichaceae bacterium]
MVITTKKGDLGLSDIKDNRLSKDELVFEVLGTIDETIAHIVLCQSITKNDEFKQIVDDLSTIAAIISGYKNLFEHERIQKLDHKIVTFHHINIFSYPYNDYNKSIINVTRTIVRRLERVYWQYHKINNIDDNVGIYLNRLSDYLFTFI